MTTYSRTRRFFGQCSIQNKNQGKLRKTKVRGSKPFSAGSLPPLELPRRVHPPPKGPWITIMMGVHWANGPDSAPGRFWNNLVQWAYVCIGFRMVRMTEAAFPRFCHCNTTMILSVRHAYVSLQNSAAVLLWPVVMCLIRFT